MVIVDVRPSGGRGDVGIPTDAYFAVEEIKDVSPLQRMPGADVDPLRQDGTATQRSFAHIPSSIEAEEAEEIGVEHLLRDIKSPHQFGTLSTRVSSQLASLKGLHSRLIEIRDYLALVAKGKLPVNHQIMYNLQDVFNLLPDLDGQASEARVKRRAFRAETNDQLMVVFLSSLVRSVLALHDLSELRPYPPQTVLTRAFHSREQDTKLVRLLPFSRNPMLTPLPTDAQNWKTPRRRNSRRSRLRPRRRAWMRKTWRRVERSGRRRRRGKRGRRSRCCAPLWVEQGCGFGA